MPGNYTFRPPPQQPYINQRRHQAGGALVAPTTPLYPFPAALGPVVYG